MVQFEHLYHMDMTHIDETEEEISFEDLEQNKNEANSENEV